MKIILLFISFAFTSNISLACTVAKSGVEFDSLITVQKIAKNTFKAVIPKKAGNLDYGVDITVAYYLKNSKYKSVEYTKRIRGIKEDGSNYIASFNLKDIEDHIPFIQVFWLPDGTGMCGAYGQSKDLILE